MFELRKKIIKIVPRKLYLKLLYYRLYGRKLDLNNPSLFTEKLFWLKRYYEKNMPDILNEAHDKFTARQYVERIIGKQYLSEIFGVYDDANDILFEKLPDSFVLKLTKLNARNIPCLDKNKIDESAVIEQMNKWLLEVPKAAKESEEGYMLEGKTRIICEESLFTSEGRTPLEYEIYCFNGKAGFIIVDEVLTDSKGLMTDMIRNVYDLNWNLIEVNFGRKYNYDRRVEKPVNFDDLIEIAEKLAEPFPFVRVDLYNIDGNVMFRELTWIPMGGNIKIYPMEYDKIFGDMLKLPEWKFR